MCRACLVCTQAYLGSKKRALAGVCFGVRSPASKLTSRRLTDPALVTTALEAGPFSLPLVGSSAGRCPAAPGKWGIWSRALAESDLSGMAPLLVQCSLMSSQASSSLHRQTSTFSHQHACGQSKLHSSMLSQQQKGMSGQAQTRDSLRDRRESWDF